MPRPRTTDAEATRKAIATAAEELFREVGYAKTTLADIAARLGMSPANIYRFFRSKLEINGFICDRLIMAFEARWHESLAPEATATENLRRYLVACHRYIRLEFLSNRGIYDMVSAAIAQNWPVMRAHMRRMTAFIADLVRVGVERGEFAPCDFDRVAELLLCAMPGFLDPRRVSRTIEECSALGVPERMEQDMLAVVLLVARGLSPHLPLPEL